MEAIPLAEVVRAIDGELVGEERPAAGVTVAGVSTDSRTITGGRLFFALRGPRFDGHDFVKEALMKGARGVVVSHLPEGLVSRDFAQDAVLVKVSCTLGALQALGGHYRMKFDIPVIAVTGSTGKTTTKDMVYSILTQRLRVVKTEANYNNDIGLPLTLLQLSHESEAAVLELGMRGAGEIRRLAEVARPTVGIVTNVGETHMELLGSKENIAAAKQELVEALPATGVAVLNADDPMVSAMSRATRARVVFYGVENPCEIRATGIVDRGVCGTTCVFKTPCGDLEVVIPIPGRHNVYNALGAAGGALALGIDLEAVSRGLEDFQPTPMRMQVVTLPGGVTVINDTYNASPASMRAALLALRDMAKGGRTLAVLGDMLELGDAAGRSHREIGRLVHESGMGFLIAVGGLARLIADGAVSAGMACESVYAAGDNDEALGKLLEVVRPGDYILVKGSRAMHMEEVVSGLVAAVPAPASGVVCDD